MSGPLVVGGSLFSIYFMNVRIKDIMKRIGNMRIMKRPDDIRRIAQATKAYTRKPFPGTNLDRRA